MEECLSVDLNNTHAALGSTLLKIPGPSSILVACYKLCVLDVYPTKHTFILRHLLPDLQNTAKLLYLDTHQKYMASLHIFMSTTGVDSF